MHSIIRTTSGLAKLTTARVHLRLRVGFCLLLFFSFFVSLVSAPDADAQSSTRIVMTDGEEYEGTIVSETADTIALQSESGAQVRIPRSSVRTVYYDASGSSDGGNGFWSFGGTLGTPSGLNLVIARNFDRDWGMRLSGGYIGTVMGVQLDGTYRIGGRRSFRHNVHLGVGTMAIETLEAGIYGGVVPATNSWTYVAGGYDLNWGGFHFAAGLSLGSGDYSNPQLTFQIGYVHQFK